MPWVQGLRVGVVLCVLCALVPAAATGQDAEPEQDAVEDSLLTYDLSEIVVSGRPGRAVRSATVQRVPLASLVQADAASIDEVTRLIPAAHVQTNSRGETLVYLRNAGERQTALFFDGALLNVPWDQRYDVSWVPTGVVGQMTVAKGVPSVLYGTNVLGGAINLTSRTLASEGALWEATARVGSAGAREGMITHLGRRGRWQYAASASYDERDGFVVADDAALPFSQPDDALRSNTDGQRVAFFGKADYAVGREGRFGLALLHLDGEKGIAPESHLDPDEATVRYWRYPSARTTLALLSGDVGLGVGTRLRGSVWGSLFAQQIDQYESAAYDVLDEVQEDDDQTVGTRVTLLQDAGRGEVRLALNALTSRHEQANRAGSGDVLEQTYRQHLYSVGAEYEWPIGRRLDLQVGASLDGTATPETGDKPARDPQTSGGVTAAVRVAIARGWSVRAAGGRKVRFPTMRELFGEALGRFLVNPDLRPETAWNAEVGLERRGTVLSGEATAFVNRTHDTIDRRNVEVDGRRLRQRINLDGSRVLGVEVVGSARPLQGLRLDGHATAMQVRAFRPDGSTRLAEKPAVLATLTATYQARAGWSALLQGVYTGRAYSLDETDRFVALPTSLVLNARGAYRLLYVGRRALAAEVFVRVNNLTDAVVVPQLGLPAPGREVSAGLNVTL